MQLLKFHSAFIKEFPKHLTAGTSVSLASFPTLVYFLVGSEVNPWLTYEYFTLLGLHTQIGLLGL